MAGFMDKIKKFVGNEDYDDEYDDLEEEVVEKENRQYLESQKVQQKILLKKQ